MTKQSKLYLLIALVIAPLFSFGQQLTKKDYARATSFMYDNYNNKTIFNLHTQVHWFEDGSGLWYNEFDAKGKLYKKVMFDNYEEHQLFDHDKMSLALSKLLNDTIHATNLPISQIDRKDDNNLSFRARGKDLSVNLDTYEITIADNNDSGSNSSSEITSPDGNWIAFTRNYNLFIRSSENNKEYQLSYKGCKNYEYASWYGWFDKMVGENGERPKRFNVNWSPDSKWISTSICDLRYAEKMYMLDWSIDSLYKPKLLSYYRGSPGDTNMVHIEPVFFNIENKKEINPGLPKQTHINAVSTQWTEASGTVIARIDERGYKNTKIIKVDLTTGEKVDLIEETSDTNIDNFNFRQIEGHNKIVFLSERSGWRQIYLLDIESKETLALTSGDYYINSINYIDEEKEVIYYMASGKDNNLNPYHQQLYSVSLDGVIKLITPEPVHHSVDFSEDGNHFADNFSTVDQPTKTVLRKSTSGVILTELTTADANWATKKGWKAPQVFNLTGKDGKSTIYGAIWKPTNFDPNKMYPIIDATYTGPHTQVFPKSFNRSLSNQSLAELGFVVMSVDGLGTSGRSKEFHNHSYKNMGNNLEDHVLAIKFLGKKYSWADSERVGIFGHSAGGYDAGHAVLAFPDVYDVAVASSADHDFRMEKAWWPEMYMGWPVDSTYHKVSNITMAGNLKGKLLVVHGGLDDNVNASATFKLAEALVKADKEFDMLIFPSQRHGYQGQHRNYFIKKRMNYFVEHLLGVEPIWDFKFK